MTHKTILLSFQHFKNFDMHALFKNKDLRCIIILVCSTIQSKHKSFISDSEINIVLENCI